MFDDLDEYETDGPPITGQSDPEYSSRIEAHRVTAEFRVARSPRKPQRSLDELPLFGDGSAKQGELF